MCKSIPIIMTEIKHIKIFFKNFILIILFFWLIIKFLIISVNFFLLKLFILFYIH